MQKICVLAIDRAKNDLAVASKTLENEFNVSIDGFLLVSKSFRASKAYKGDEANGFFKELLVDFNNTEDLKKIVTELTSSYDFTVAHCIIEAAMTDYRQVIPFIKNGLLQTPESLEIASEKMKMRQAFQSYAPEITPKFIVLKNYNDFIESDIQSFEYPLIVKPNGLTASYLVSKCNDLNELKSALHLAFDQIDDLYAREHGVGEKSIIVEEFIEGQLFSIDAYVLNDNSIIYLPPVKVVTSHDVGLPGFYGHERLVPSDLSDKDVQEANECVEKTVRSIGLYNSTVHVELYKTNFGWKTVEIGPRIGGYRQELYKAAYGIEHFYNDVLLHFGKVPRINTTVIAFAAAINIYPEKEGTITAINGTHDAEMVSSVFKLTVHNKIGDKANFAINGGKYTVDALLANKDRDSLIHDIEQVRRQVTIEVSDE